MAITQRLVGYTDGFSPSHTHGTSSVHGPMVLNHIFCAGYSDEEYESDPETKVKGPKPAKDGSEDSDVSAK